MTDKNFFELNLAIQLQLKNCSAIVQTTDLVKQGMAT